MCILHCTCTLYIHTRVISSFQPGPTVCSSCTVTMSFRTRTAVPGMWNGISTYTAYAYSVYTVITCIHVHVHCCFYDAENTCFINICTRQYTYTWTRIHTVRVHVQCTCTWYSILVYMYMYNVYCTCTMYMHIHCTCIIP